MSGRYNLTVAWGEQMASCSNAAGFKDQQPVASSSVWTLLDVTANEVRNYATRQCISGKMETVALEHLAQFKSICLKLQPYVLRMKKVPQTQLNQQG